MSILERALGAKAKAVDPTALQTRLADATRRIRELESQFAAVALEWASGGSAEAAKRDRLEADLAAAKRDRDALAAALALAREAEAARERENAAAIRAKQIRAVVQHTAARTKAAAEMTMALEAVVAAFRELISRSEKARAANPVGGPWPMGGLVEFHEIKRLVEIELYRLSQVPGSLNRARSFPGSDPHNVTLPDPASLKPIAEVLQAADEHVVNTLKQHKIDAPVAATGAQRAELPAFAEPPLVDESALQPFTGNPNALPPVTKLSVTD
jgi:hypothetical protein